MALNVQKINKMKLKTVGIFAALLIFYCLACLVSTFFDKPSVFFIGWIGGIIAYGVLLQHFEKESQK